ncbi:tRNA-splicing endonuclease subunit [Metarhizium rileyi]|uniref:tRNA-splicing endonuclease subunit Sen34 n=1 Tax=Metarhizium rileyi (strain RCEF 4871) TaxID=1649241 RepID=A0A5C6GPR4_METRR|nr:tRNA-splicing endonuclease subunit [Metarhizium rileyi]
MTSTDDHFRIKHERAKISMIAGRYLLFDPDAVALLRRNDNTNGTLAGTTPQQPTQNLFLGLPVELRPEEAYTLVRTGSAYIVDDSAAHRTALDLNNTEARAVYIDFLRQRKRIAQHALAERASLRTALKPNSRKQSIVGLTGPYSKGIDNHSVTSDIITYSDDDQKASTVGLLAFTPASSHFLLSRSAPKPPDKQAESVAPLCRYLQKRGNYMTPGLRFGAHYSVYPGDPLRFHAHFMANEYEWDEHIAILDIVGGGRLATAVKKAFLFGGQQPGYDSPHKLIHTYSVEWAAM